MLFCVQATINTIVYKTHALITFITLQNNKHTILPTYK